MYEFERKQPSVARRRRRTSGGATPDRPTVQRKLLVGAVDDPAEHEADRVADAVVARIRAGVASRTLARTGPAANGAGASVSPAIGRMAHRAAAGSSAGAVPLADETAGEIRRMAGRGAALPATVRRSMEDAFGSDFSQVRLHRGAASERLNDELGARAFTTGADVFLGRGVDPGSVDGTRLVAHELAHVVQQGGATVRRDVVRRDKKGGGGKGGAAPKKEPFWDVTTSSHYGHSRDDEHRNGKDALEAADSDYSISEKLYQHHNAKINALTTSFPTSSGQFLVVCTFANLRTGVLTYHTAYLSKTPASSGMPNTTYWNPQGPVIPV